MSITLNMALGALAVLLCASTSTASRLLPASAEDSGMNAMAGNNVPFMAAPGQELESVIVTVRFSHLDHQACRLLCGSIVRHMFC